MAIKNVEIQDSSGNSYYPHTDSSVVKRTGTTANVEETLKDIEANYLKKFELPTKLPANGGNSDTVDGKHASDFLQSATELLAGTNIINYINAMPNDTCRRIRVISGADAPPNTNSDNDYNYLIFKIDNLWWTAMAIDVRTYRIYTRNCNNGTVGTWQCVSDNGNAYSISGVPLANLVRQYDLNAININTTGGSFIVNISDTSHGTTPDGGFWNILQYQGGHFLTQIATKTSGDVSTMIRTKYSGDTSWGAWNEIYTSAKTRPTVIQSTSPADTRALWVY